MTPDNLFTKTIYNPYRKGGQKVPPITSEEYQNMRKYLESVHKK